WLPEIREGQRAGVPHGTRETEAGGITRTSKRQGSSFDYDPVGLVKGVGRVLVARVRKSSVAPASAPAVANDEMRRGITDDGDGVAAIGSFPVVLPKLTVCLDVVPARVHFEAGQDRAVICEPFLEAIELPGLGAAQVEVGLHL